MIINQEAYRSCVPKVSAMKLNCTGDSTARLAVCYCHEDHCNGANSNNNWSILMGIVSMVAAVTLAKSNMAAG